MTTERTSEPARACIPAMETLTVDEPDTSEIRVVPAPLDFATFYEREYAAVAGALAYTLGDTALGREAADEAMARAFARWSSIREYDNPGGWVYRVGLNWARSVHRRAIRRLPLRGRDEVSQPPVADPAIAQALADLDVPLRAVVVCRLLLDWSVDDTAHALGVRPGTVKSRLHRALGLLETALGHLR
jgi:DNA-directed RNA polymerase specialized sigma24 family protein